MRVNVRFPTLDNKSIRTAGKDNEQNLVKSILISLYKKVTKKDQPEQSNQ